MARSSILFLSIFVCSFAQAQDICNDKKIVDSLVKHYLEDGAERTSYNSAEWQMWCDSLIAICPNIAEAYRLKAIPYIKNGDWETAYKLEDKAMELDPKQLTAYHAFLKCIFTKDYRSAIDEFNQAEKISPHGFEMDHTYSFYKGISYLALKEYASAEKELLQDVRTQQDGNTARSVHFNTYHYLGILYLEMKQYKKAQGYFFKALKNFPLHPDANFYLAKTYTAAGEKLKSKQCLQNAAEGYKKGYRNSEDNEYYTNYPYQVTLYEINQAMGLKK